VSTAELVRRLTGISGQVEAINSAAGGKLGRMGTYVRAAGRIALGARRADVVYVSLFARTGMWMSLIYCVLARCMGATVVVHHHTRPHLEHARAPMTLICRICPDATHIVLCDYMKDRLHALYRVGGPVHLLSNAFVIDGAPAGGERAGTTIRLGHLSNLVFAKGLGRAIQIFEALLADGMDAELHVAGPFMDKESETAVHVAAQKFPGRFVYWGPVDEAEKARFFSSIDLFVFLSLYRNETEGIVVLESLAYGNPVIVHEICCVASAAGVGPHSLVVAPGADYVELARRFVAAYLADRVSVRAAAQERFRTAKRQSEEQLVLLLSGLSA
jgi:glycosyltransferase involved in cell wall biosynthesis